MNSIQLAQRLARNLNVTDTSNLDAEAALDVLQAMNAGLAALYRDLPGIYKRTTLSQALKTPRTLSLVFEAKYSRFVADDTFSEGEIGCTVRMENGGADNVVTGLNCLLDDYLRDDLTTQATVYYDAVPVQDVIERIIGNVRLYDANSAAPTMLLRDERLRGGIARGFSSHGGSLEDTYYPVPNLELGRVGRPLYYYLEPAGVSQGAEPEFLLRVSPLPDKDYTVRLEAELSTQRILFADLSTARAIYVPDNLIDEILIPLCEAELTSSRFWAREQRDVAGVSQRAEMIKQRTMGKVPSDIAPTFNSVGTPRGF